MEPSWVRPGQYSSLQPQSPKEFHVTSHKRRNQSSPCLAMPRPRHTQAFAGCRFCTVRTSTISRVVFPLWFEYLGQSSFCLGVYGPFFFISLITSSYITLLSGPDLVYHLSGHSTILQNDFHILNDQVLLCSFPSWPKKAIRESPGFCWNSFMVLLPGDDRGGQPLDPALKPGHAIFLHGLRLRLLEKAW